MTCLERPRGDKRPNIFTIDTYVPKSVLKDHHATAGNQHQQQQQVLTPAIVVSIAAATGPTTTTAMIDHHGSYHQLPPQQAPTKTKHAPNSKLLLGAKGNRYNNSEEEEVERHNSEDEADEYEYQEYKRARKLKKQQKQEAKELKAAEKQREKQKKKDRKRALKKAKAGGRRVSVSTSASRRGSQSSESYNHGASGGGGAGRQGLGIVGSHGSGGDGRGGEEQEEREMVTQGFSTARRESLGGVAVMKKRSRVAKLFLRKKPETTPVAITTTYARMTKPTGDEDGEECIALQPLECRQGQEEERRAHERNQQSGQDESTSSPLPETLPSLDHSPPQHLRQVDNLSSSPFTFSSASTTPSSSKPHKLDLSFGKNKGGRGKEGVKGKGGVGETTTLKSPSSPHGGAAGGGNCGRCYLRRVWSKIKHPHRSSNKPKPGTAAAVMVPVMNTKKSLAAQE